MRLAVLCTNWQCCCLPRHIVVRLTPAIDSVLSQVWTCYGIVESVWSEDVFVRCVTKMDRQKFEQRCAVKFCVKLGKSAAVTYEKLQRAYWEHSLSRAQAFRWHNSFLEGWEQVEDEPRVGRLSTSKTDDNVERVRSLVRSDHRLTLRMISSELNFNWFTIHQILTQDLGKRSVCQDRSKEPHNWAEGQSEGCVSWYSGPPWEGARILQSCYHRWWIMNFGVWPRHKTKSGVAHFKLSPSQESKNEQIQNQIGAHLFFWQSWDRPQGICATRTNCQSNLLSGSPWKTREKGGTCATRHCTLLDAAPPQCPMSHGSIHQWIFGRKKHSCCSSASLFAGSHSLRIIFILLAQKPLKKGANLVLWLIPRRA